MRKFFIPLLVASLLAGCGTAPVMSGGASVAPSLPLPAPAAGAVHYTVDAAHSEVRFLVYKTGPLAALGHDHVILARDFTGEAYLAADFAASTFSLSLPVKSFLVDDPAARAVEGPDFAVQPSPQAVAGTLSNMLGAQELDAEHYPEVRIQSLRLVGPDWGPDMTVRITLHGTARDITLPVAITRQGDELTASGAFDLKQSDFGIKPLSVAGGGLQVADTLRVRFHILAHKS